MLQRQEFMAKVKAFSQNHASEHRILVDEYDAVYVYDSVAKHYTVLHGLSVAQQRRLRVIAQKRRK